MWKLAQLTAAVALAGAIALAGSGGVAAKTHGSHGPSKATTSAVVKATTKYLKHNGAGEFTLGKPVAKGKDWKVTVTGSYAELTGQCGGRSSGQYQVMEASTGYVLVRAKGDKVLGFIPVVLNGATTTVTCP